MANICWFSYPIMLLSIIQFNLLDTLMGTLVTLKDSLFQVYKMEIKSLLSRGVYSSRKSELFPSAQRRLPNPSPTAKLQVPPNQGYIDPCLFLLLLLLLILWGCYRGKCLLGPTGGGCLRGECPPQKLENFAFLKLESCNLVKTF